MPSSSSSCSTIKLLLNILILFVIFCNIEGVIKLPPNETIPAVIAFGDSIFDTGNNNNRDTFGKCNFLPYGKDFQGGIPTGRFSNGKVPPDIIGSALSLFLSLSLDVAEVIIVKEKTHVDREKKLIIY
jgi:hypothetical protein